MAHSIYRKLSVSENPSASPLSEEQNNISDDDSGEFINDSDRVLVFSKKTTPISEVPLLQTLVFQ